MFKVVLVYAIIIWKPSIYRPIYARRLPSYTHMQEEFTGPAVSDAESVSPSSLGTKYRKEICTERVTVKPIGLDLKSFDSIQGITSTSTAEPLQKSVANDRN